MPNIDIGITNTHTLAIVTQEWGYTMPSSVKTAISLKQHLFDDVNELANEMKISRSKVFVLAVEDFIKKYENKKLLSQINEAFIDYPDDEEKENNDLMRKKHRKILETEKW